jgi:tRNA (guanine-N7-)-methyltransferase
MPGAKGDFADGVMKAGEGNQLPNKRFFRQRAHCNPLSNNLKVEGPWTPGEVDWLEHYPEPLEDGSARAVDIADVGCGYGGLSMTLAKELPEMTTLGMEIRHKVVEYVRLRILALRKQEPGKYQNASVLRTNAMRTLVTHFTKGQLSKLFFCYPDPHFKAKNHRRRIVTPALLADYAWVLRPGGILYTVTDVPELHEWMAEHGRAHPAFREYSEEEYASDPCVGWASVTTEESAKAVREGRRPHPAVFVRLTDEETAANLAERSFWDASYSHGAGVELGTGGDTHGVGVGRKRKERS